MMAPRTSGSMLAVLDVRIYARRTRMKASTFTSEKISRVILVTPALYANAQAVVGTGDLLRAYSVRLIQTLRWCDWGLK